MNHDKVDSTMLKGLNSLGWEIKKFQRSSFFKKVKDWDGQSSAQMETQGLKVLLQCKNVAGWNPSFCLKNKDCAKW